MLTAAYPIRSVTPKDVTAEKVDLFEAALR
jgi:hypothetical protein